MTLLFPVRRTFCSQSSKQDNQGKRKSDDREADAKRTEGSAQGDENTDKDTAAKDESGGGIRKGEAISVLGITGFAMSMVVQSPPGRAALRVLGPAGMLFGVMVSIYEFGGWQGILAVPVVLGGGFALSGAADSSAEKKLKDAILADVVENCPNVPSAEATDAMQSSRGHEYENNRMRLDVQWQSDAGGARWRIEATASRPSMFQSWSITLLRLSQVAKECGSPTANVSVQPPRQTRFWDAHSVPVKWSTSWERP